MDGQILMVYGELPDLLCAGSPIEEKCEIKVGTWESNPGPLHFPPTRLPTEPIVLFEYIMEINYNIIKIKR